MSEIIRWREHTIAGRRLSIRGEIGEVTRWEIMTVREAWVAVPSGATARPAATPVSGVVDLTFAV